MKEMTYAQKHAYIRKLKPCPIKCEKCHIEKNSLDLANISGKYLLDTKDYIYLCKVCHSKMDYGKRTKNKKLDQSMRCKVNVRSNSNNQSLKGGLG